MRSVPEQDKAFEYEYLLRIVYPTGTLWLCRDLRSSTAGLGSPRVTCLPQWSKSHHHTAPKAIISPECPHPEGEINL